MGPVGLFVSGTAAAGLALASSAVWADMKPGTRATAIAPPTTRDISVEQEPIAQLQGALSQLHIVAWVNRRRGIFSVGEFVTVFAKANEDAYITVLNVGTSGKTTVLFPNRYRRSNRIRAGQVIRIPDRRASFRFHLDGPPGIEVIKVIASKEPVRVYTVNTTPIGPFNRLAGSGAAVARDIKVTLKKRHHDRFAAYTELIRVVRRQRLMLGVVAPTSSVMPGARRTKSLAPTTFKLRIGAAKTGYKIGAPISVSVETERDCNLTLLDVGTSGQVHAIFPNKYQRNALIRAGQHVIVPSIASNVIFTVNGPPGVETIVGMCRTGTDQPPIIGAQQAQQVFPSLGPIADVARDIAIATRPSITPGTVTAYASKSIIVWTGK